MSQMQAPEAVSNPPIAPSELPDEVELAYADDRGRRHVVALDGAATLSFETGRPFREPPAYRGQGNFPGWWWSATTRSHVAYESWLERHYLIESDRNGRVVSIAGQPFELAWSHGNKQVRHVPDLFCRTLDGGGAVTDCRPADKADDDFRYKASVTAAACAAIGWGYRVVGEPDPVWAANLRWLAGYRHPRFGDEDLETTLLELFAIPQMLAEAAREAGDPIQVRPVLYHLLWRGRLSGDLSRPLGETTVLTACADPLAEA